MERALRGFLKDLQTCEFYIQDPLLTTTGDARN